MVEWLCGRDGAAGVLKFFEVGIADAVIAAKFDCVQLFLADPAPNRDDLDPVTVCHLSAGMQFGHLAAPFFVYFNSCVLFGFVIL